MPEENWKLGKHLSVYDNLLDGLTFDEMIITAHCNCRKLTPEAVRREYKALIRARLEDAAELLERNLDQIIAEAKKGRCCVEEEAA